MKIILTAFQGGNSMNSNIYNLLDLKDHFHGSQIIWGMYKGKLELSLLINNHHHSLKKCLDLAKEYQQDYILMLYSISKSAHLINVKDRKTCHTGIWLNVTKKEAFKHDNFSCINDKYYIIL